MRNGGVIGEVGGVEEGGVVLWVRGAEAEVVEEELAVYDRGFEAEGRVEASLVGGDLRGKEEEDSEHEGDGEEEVGEHFLRLVVVILCDGFRMLIGAKWSSVVALPCGLWRKI